MRNAAASQRFGESLLGGEERWPRQSAREAYTRKLAGFAPRREIDGPVFPISRLFLWGIVQILAIPR